MNRMNEYIEDETAKRVRRTMFFNKKVGRNVNSKSTSVQELLEKNKLLESEIKEKKFMYLYNEKMLMGIIKNNERLIERYLSMSSQNTEEIKLATDEFKTNLSNMNEGLQQMTQAVSDLSVSTTKQNDFCKQILDQVESVKSNNQLSYSDMQNLNASVKNLEEHSSILHDLVQNVEDIAERLRYMSFNGKIQAASLELLEKKVKNIKPGAVAGFTVVASQMEKLSYGVARLVDSQNSSTARIVNNILSLVDLSKQVEALDLDNLTSVKEVAGLIGRLHDELGTVASSSEELSATAEEFATSIEELYATIENISRRITDFYDSVKKEVIMYNKVSKIAGEIRRIAGRSKTLHDAAQHIVAYIRSEFVNPETKKSSISMARLFVTIPFRHLPGAYKEKYYMNGVTDDSMFLCLMGTVGDNPDWNDIRNSKKRQAVLLPEREEDFALMPMLARNFTKMGIQYDEIIHPRSGAELTTIEDYALEKDVRDSPYIPDQKFVSEYHLVSQIGIGGVFPSGSIFTAFMFFNEPVDDDFAGTFMIIPMALQMALKDFDLDRIYW